MDRDSQAGFTLLEMLVALTLALVVGGGTLAVLSSHTAATRTQPEVVDLQQRARAAVDLLTRDLYMAGAGLYLGPSTGSLQGYFASVVPRRMGLQRPDGFNVARPDAVTVFYVPETMAQTELAIGLPSAGANLDVRPFPHCPPATSLCGLGVGDAVVVFDRESHFDFFTVTQVNAGLGVLRSWQSGHASHAYSPGAVVSAAAWHTYYFDRVNRQLRHFDGYLTDTPVVDDVVDLAFEYWGTPAPPEKPRPPLGVANCLYDAAGGGLGGFQLMPAQGSSLAALPLAAFTDGPWCGDGDNTFDADLLRIRRVRVTLRLQVSNEMLRGRSADFAIAGKNRTALTSVADYTVRFDVSPRNLGGQRW